MSEMKVPEGYKQTEVGVIPEDWKVVSLSEAVDFLDGQRRPVKSSERAKINGVYPYYGASGIVDYVNDYIFNEELILLGEDGENILSRNLPLAFKVSGKIWVNNHAHVMRPNKDFNITFLTEFLESLDYSLLNSGSAQPKLNKASCLKIRVVKPSKKEQTAIATALSDVDNLIQSLEKLIAKKEAIKTGTMQQLLTGKTRLPDFATHDGGSPKGFKQTELGRIPEDWEVNYIGKIANFRNGVAHENFIDTNGHYIAVNSKFISTEGKVYKRTKILRNPAYKDEILMVMSDLPNGKALAKCFLVTVNNAFSVNQRICSLNIVSDIPKFVFYQLNRNPFYLAFDDGVKQTNLRRQDVLDCPVALPSIKEQTAIATILSDMDTEIQVLQERLEKTRDIKQGMMQQLLTGKVRLVNPSDKSDTQTLASKGELQA